MVENQFRTPEIRGQIRKVDDEKPEIDIVAVSVEKITFALTRVLNT